MRPNAIRSSKQRMALLASPYLLVITSKCFRGKSIVRVSPRGRCGRLSTRISLGILPNIKRKRGWLGKFLGYDEYTNAMFLFAVDSVYMVQLKSFHSKKLYETSYSNAMPCHAFSSFYTPGTAITGGGAEMLHDS